jgi:predicted phage tail protein
MREIKLYGALAKFVGQRRFSAEVSSAAEGLRMLLANFPGLEQHMAERHYKVIVDNYESSLDEIHYPASQTIKFVPVVGGAGGGGTGKIFAGIGLIAAAIILAPLGGGFLGLGAGAFTSTTGTAIVAGTATSFAATGALAAASVAIGSIGAALVLGGVSQLLTPTPQIGSFGPASVGNARSRNTSTQATELDPQESYSFSGIQNTSRQGTPVPVVYGETIVGSVVISAGIDVDTI